MPLVAKDIEEILERYFIKGERSDDIVRLEPPETEVDPSVVDALLSAEKAHDDDYVVFQYFTDEKTTILDIGANYGYSATSMWFVGVKAAIVSFEPLKPYAPVLAEIARKVNPEKKTFLEKLFGKAPRYEYYTTGVSDREGEITFHVGVLNGRMVSALTTASMAPHIPSYVENIFSYAQMCSLPVESFKIYSFDSHVTTIDNWVASRKSKTNLRNIVALKIDTEGLEGLVLVGASKLLKKKKPLIMAESGHQIELAVKTAFDNGYVFAERDGEKLRVSDSKTQHINGFFVHPAKFAYYKRIGLM